MLLIDATLGIRPNEFPRRSSVIPCATMASGRATGERATNECAAAKVWRRFYPAARSISRAFSTLDARERARMVIAFEDFARASVERRKMGAGRRARRKMRRDDEGA